MNAPRCCSVVVTLVTCLLASTSSALAQAAKSTATEKDVAYDSAHASQKLDVYLAESETPLPAMVFIHGGGWRGGSKNSVPGWLLNAVREKWLSVVSIEYRFSDVAPHPAQVKDCLRAIQFVRHNAAKWRIDPQRIGVTGGSAGGHLSLWVAVHDDAAEAKSNDPVARQSSRVACAVSFAGPTDWSLLTTLEHKHPAYRQLLGYAPGTPASEMDAKAKTDVSPISFVSPDDPPIMQVHGDKDDIVPIEHARNMHERLKKAGVKTELVVIPGANHGVAGAGPQVTERAIAFVRETLHVQPPAPTGQDKVLLEEHFDGRLQDGWQWVREDKSEWRISDNQLEVRSQPGRIWGGNDAKNVLLRRPLKPPHLAASVSVAHKPGEKWEQAGLLWYVDDDNFVKLISEHIDGKMYAVTAREQGGKGSVVGKIEVPSANLQLRLRVQAGRVTGQWRLKSDDTWSDAGTCEFGVQGDPRFGLFTQNGPPNETRWVRFDDFSICALAERR
jgi:acetyl esterase/lipase/regulation of enolase protein 1 (concanavalin A-like superfamily)